MPNTTTLTIGQVATRTGLAVSAIRFYADEGLVHPIRSDSGHRYFQRADVRRVSFILIAQQLGFTLKDIAEALAPLPKNRAPSKKDWDRMARQFEKTINNRIERLSNLRDNLNSCIGCGCLSLNKCRLYNPEDKASQFGAGPRYLQGDKPSDL